MAHVSVISGRRADLDWIRIGALALLILYHVGLVFTPWDWHINSTHRFLWMEPATLVTSPWRLTILFLVSGCALRLMSRRLEAREVLQARFARLAPPFLFGFLVLVPPQAWIEAIDKGWWNGDVFSWLATEYAGSGLHDGLPINHLWFVLYIAVYSLAAVALLARPALMQRLEDGLDKTLSGWRLLVLPILYLAVVRQLLFPWFGLNNQLLIDWYNHFQSLGVFLFGFLLVGRQSLWSNLERFRWIAAPAALASLGCLMALHTHPGGDVLFGSVRNSVYAVNQWMTVCAILGFGSKYLRHADSPVRAYLNDAIFPAYLAHQTILIFAVWYLRPAGLPAWVEAPLMVLITLGGSLLVYEAVRRVGWLRPLWGLKPFAPAPETPSEARKALMTAVANRQAEESNSSGPVAV